MANPALRRPFASLVVLLVSAGSAAAAAYDMSGKWAVVGGFAQHWDVTQSAGDLAVSTEFGTASGTIDENTGAFSVDLPDLPTCGANTFDGDVAADGRSFTATQVLWNRRCTTMGGAHCDPCEQSTFMVVGTRCGNGELDAGEECDDGNRSDGDCCSSSCTYDAAESVCRSDGDVCTDDVCDGAGTCTHVDNTAPCADPNGCGTGNCASGSCVIAAPAPSGTSCDLDASVCTPDACNGSGACAPATPIDCAPCGVCDPTAGCVDDGGAACDRDPGDVKLSVKLDDDKRKRLKLALVDGIPLADFGDPLASTDYRLCLYRDDGPVIFAGEVPAGGTCKGKPCWKSQKDGFKYRDAAQNADGITAIDLRTFGRGIKIEGKGANLPLPTTLPDPVDIVAKVIAGQGAATKCWRHVVPRSAQEPQGWQGHYQRLQ